ncbi:MAG TPA: LacI family DNA-binding transcriptional regulator [Paenibacillus sp.]|uniref:LacI family DNA-binding transcriptional regulator n=1 Tax=Paenibacillus sp. TaxID=58172 RepID=UPI002C304AE0|nr:LacI family DNA-binding transcriptional regulator [Paenibacillus sp.]HUC94014.1 LacI family DNA-binding transcriptional regulator [Paenibacillus sp.]
MATRKEVADMAGVSEATVSRVMNGVGPIRESTRQRVLEAAQKLNYHMNAIASSFARGRSGNLGVVIPHVPKVRLFSTYYFSEMMSGIGEAARAHGCGLLLLYRDPAEPYDYVSLFRTQRIDGCLVLGASSLPSETAGIAAMAEEGLPFCLIDQSFDDPRASTVVAAHKTGSYLAVKHLIESGCRRIGFLNGSPHYSTSADRLAGYIQALKESGLGFDPRLLYEGNYSMTSGRAAAAAVYADRGKLDAIFAANDRMAIGLLQGLREKGCRAPADIPIVGYDDSDASRMSDPPLTTVKVPFYEMGLTAADMLLERIPDWLGEASVFRRTMPTELVIRKSSAR